MKISAKTEYACIAMVELAAGYESGQPVRIGTIAHDNGIPSQFLVQILLQLKAAGLVRSLRGAAGGYRLIKPPAEITLGDVMRVMDAAEQWESSAGVDSAAVNVLDRAWREVAQAERRLLDATTLAELADRRARQLSQPMYYI